MVFIVMAAIIAMFLMAPVVVLIRNDAVFKYRCDLIEKDYAGYSRLPTYDTMVRKFWVWPVSKFYVPEEKP